MNKVLLLFIVIFSAVTSANTAFEIPRSTVIDLIEPSTKRVYPIFIKLPRSYSKDGEKIYPVIYLTDALYSFQLVSGATRFPMNSGAMDEAIIVGIAYSKGSSGSSSRVRDYTPVKAEKWKLATGNAKGHARFIEKVVFAHIEKNYRVDQSKRTFVGNSLGGLFGAYILFNSPEMFSSYILGSPSIWFNNSYMLEQPINNSAKQVMVYLSVGRLESPEYGEREDMVAATKALAEKIDKESAFNLKLSIIKGASHTTAFPTTAIQGLDWIYSSKK